MSKILEAMKEKFISFITKNEDSDLIKKLRMLAEEMEIVQTAFDDIEEVKNLNDAYGKTLDHYGANVGESRKGNDDTLYRLLIRIKIAENTSDGSIPHIIDALSLAIDRPPEDIYVQEGWSFVTEEQPASIFLSFPSEVFSDYNITYERFINLFNNVVGGGISTDFFLIEEDDINIVATMPYTEMSTLPYCDTVKTGEWTDQFTGEIYLSNVYEKYSTQKQEYPFLAGLYSGSTEIDYPQGVIDRMNVQEIYSTADQILPFTANLISGGYEESNRGYSFKSILNFNISFEKYAKDYNYCNTFRCGEVAI
jgi:hypothetical protein